MTELTHLIHGTSACQFPAPSSANVTTLTNNPGQ